jgi:hypothetical protein
MPTLTGQQILRAWEVGARQSLLERALTILAVAFPDTPRDEWEMLPIGQRDAALLMIWRDTFGSSLNGYAECPQCHARLEFRIRVEDITHGGMPASQATFHVVSEADYEVQFRLIDSRDLRAASACPDPGAARGVLLNRSVVWATRAGIGIGLGALPGRMITNLVEAMLEFDPQAEVLLDLHCPGCAHEWQEFLEPAAFLWTEIAVHAKRLLGEVHTLARAYAWTEAEILSMSACRRQAYLEIAGA